MMGLFLLNISSFLLKLLLFLSLRGVARYVAKQSVASEIMLESIRYHQQIATLRCSSLAMTGTTQLSLRGTRQSHHNYFSCLCGHGLEIRASRCGDIVERSGYLVHKFFNFHFFNLFHCNTNSIY